MLLFAQCQKQTASENIQFPMKAKVLNSMQQMEISPTAKTSHTHTQKKPYLVF